MRRRRSAALTYTRRTTAPTIVRTTFIVPLRRDPPSDDRSVRPDMIARLAVDELSSDLDAIRHPADVFALDQKTHP